MPRITQVVSGRTGTGTCLLTLFFFWLCWVFVSMRGLSLVAASGGHSPLRCAGLSLSWPLLLRSTGSRRAGSVVVAHGPSCSAACGILPDQGSNPRPPHRQADSQPLCHQGSPLLTLIPIYSSVILLREWADGGISRWICPLSNCTFGPKCRLEINEVASPK